MIAKASRSESQTSSTKVSHFQRQRTRARIAARALGASGTRRRCAERARLGHALSRRQRTNDRAARCRSPHRGVVGGAAASVRHDHLSRQFRQLLFYLYVRASSSSIQSPTAASARLPLSINRDTRLSTQSRTSGTLMILPQVHLRKPCYDFYFL